MTPRHWNFSAAPLCLAVIASLATLTACGGSSALKLPGQYHPALQADGHADDWNSLSARYIQKEEVVVGTANDADYLYVMLRFRNPQYARQILTTGLTLWIDPTGGTDKRYLLKYRGGVPPESGDLPEHVRNELRRLRPDWDSLGAETLHLAVKDLITEKPIPVTGDEGPSIMAGKDQDFYVYEFRLPLAESRVRYYGLGATPGQAIGVGIRWGDLPKFDMAAEMNRSRTFGEEMMTPPDNARPRAGETPPDGPQAARGKQHEILLQATIAPTATD